MHRLASTVVMVVLAATAGASQSQQLVVQIARELVDEQRRVRVHEGRVFILSGREGIVVFDRDFERQARFGTIGRGPTDLRLPMDFDVCGDGDVVVADLGGNSVWRFDKSGAAKSSFKTSDPQYITCLGNGDVAVGARTAQSFIQVYRGEKMVREIGTPAPYPGATARQTVAFQFGPFRELRPGTFLLIQALSLPPTVVILSEDNRVDQRFSLPADELEPLLGEARETRAEMMAKGRSGGRGTVNFAAIHPTSGDVWIAPGAEGIFRFSATGKVIDRLDVVDAAGNRYGFQDFEFLGPNEIVGRAGTLTLRAKLSAK